MSTEELIEFAGLELDHIGYAVRSIEAYLREFVLPVLVPESVSETVEDLAQSVRIAFVTLRGGGVIELIEPLSDSSPVSARLRQRRGGLYHLCFRTPNIASGLQRFVNQGCRIVASVADAPALGGRRFAFVFTPQGDLFELVEDVPR